LRLVEGEIEHKPGRSEQLTDQAFQTLEIDDDFIRIGVTQ
jgi:hypothetical protein